MIGGDPRRQARQHLRGGVAVRQRHDPIGEARAEWEIFVDLARRVDPQFARGIFCATW